MVPGRGRLRVGLEALRDAFLQLTLTRAQVDRWSIIAATTPPPTTSPQTGEGLLLMLAPARFAAEGTAYLLAGQAELSDRDADPAGCTARVGVARGCRRFDAWTYHVGAGRSGLFGSLSTGSAATVVM
jgi:hypothetical protein